MKSFHKRNPLFSWVIGLVLLVVAMTASADRPDFDIPLDYLPIVDYHPAVTLGEPITVRNSEAYATRLISVPGIGDLDYPMGIFFNGVPGYEISRYNGFVEIAIGGNGLDAGISGFVQEQCIVDGDSAGFTLPSATLKGEASLLLDYADDAPVISTHPAGTEVALIGYMNTWCQVQLGDVSGFLKTDQLSFGEETAAVLASVMPEKFDRYTAKEKHAMDICGAYTDEKNAIYGDMEHWPLEVKAEFAALSIQLGRGQVFDLGVDIMPGPDDLQQDEAMAIAKQAVTERYPITLAQLDSFDMWFTFFDSNFYRTGHYWHFTFVGGGYYITVLISSPAGEVIEIA